MIFQILDHPTTTITGNFFNLTAHESGYPFWVPYIQQYFEDIGIEIRKVDFSNLDLSKPWILSLPPNGWNWSEDYDKDFLEVFEPNVRQELVHGNGYLIVNHEAESFTLSFYRELHRFLSNSELSPNKVIYMVGATDPEVEYKKFVEEHKIPTDKQIKIISSHHVHRRFHPLHIQTLLENRNNNSFKKDRKFLSLNRVPKLHRVTMVSLMSYYDLLEQGYVSLGLYPEDLIDNKFYPALNTIPDYTRLKFKIKQGFGKIFSKLPLKVDQVDLRENQYAVQSLPSMFYDKTYFSLVSSTFAMHDQEPCVGFTEKEMRPIIFKQPFLLHNLPGALKQLKKMGFLSFDRWFDESYDEEVNDMERMHKLVLEVQRLCLIPNEQWDKMLEEMQPVLLHNYNILIKYNKEHIFFHSDLKNLIHYAA